MQKTTNSKVRPAAAGSARGLWPSKRDKSGQSPKTGVSPTPTHRKRSSESDFGFEATLPGLLLLWLAFSAHLASTGSLAEALPDIIKIGKAKEASPAPERETGSFCFYLSFWFSGSRRIYPPSLMRRPLCRTVARIRKRGRVHFRCLQFGIAKKLYDANLFRKRKTKLQTVEHIFAWWAKESISLLSSFSKTGFFCLRCLCKCGENFPHFFWPALAILTYPILCPKPGSMSPFHI